MGPLLSVHARVEEFRGTRARGASNAIEASDAAIASDVFSVEARHLCLCKFAFFFSGCLINSPDSRMSVSQFISNPLGWIPETGKFNENKDNSDIEKRVVNVWFDASNLKPFQLKAEDTGSIVRLDFSQRWADNFSLSSTYNFVIQLPPVKSVQPMHFDFDFAMQDSSSVNLKTIPSTWKITVQPAPGTAYTNARLVGGVFLVTGESGASTITWKDAVQMSTGEYDSDNTFVIAASGSGIKPLLLASSHMKISTSGMRDWTKHDKSRYSDPNFKADNMPSGDPVFWHVSGVFVGTNTNAGFGALSS